MRKQTLLIGCLIILATLIIGCAPSPYEMVERRQTQLDEWKPILESDAWEFIETGLVRSVNERLASYSGVTHVKVYEFDRVVYFEYAEPKPESIPGSDIIAPEARLSPNPGGPIDANVTSMGEPLIATHIPDGVIASDEWTDRYALAQEVSCRAKVVLAELKEVDPDSSTPFLVYVAVEITGQKRHAIAGQAQPLPVPPEDHRYWMERPIHGSFYGSGGYAIYVPPQLPGSPHEPGTDSLTDEAADKLAEEDPTSIVEKTVFEVAYDAKTSQWKIIGLAGNRPITLKAKSLSWGYGLGPNQRTVYAPR